MQEVLLSKLGMTAAAAAAAVDSYNYIDCTPVAVDTGCLDTLEWYHSYFVQQVAAVEIVAAAAAAVDKQLDTASESVLTQNKV